MKCLAKEPLDRYSTAQALAADLERFLAGEPLRGLSLGPWESIKCRIRRHSGAVIFGFTTAVLSAALLGQTLWFELRLAKTRENMKTFQESAPDRDLATRPDGVDRLHPPPLDGRTSRRRP